PFRPITLMLSPGSRASVMSSSTTVSPYPAETWRSASASAAMRLAQVDRAHLRVRRDLVGSTAGEHGSAHEDRDLFREAEGGIHVGSEDKHADVRGQSPDGVEDDVARGARHARGRLVEQQDLRAQSERDRELDEALAAVRQLGHATVGIVREPQALE